MMPFDKRQSPSTWAEDRATQRCDPSAVPGAKTEGRAVLASGGHPISLHLRNWHQSAKPSRHDAATVLTRCPSSIANADLPKFQFTVNQDSGNGELDLRGHRRP